MAWHVATARTACRGHPRIGADWSHVQTSTTDFFPPFKATIDTAYIPERMQDASSCHRHAGLRAYARAAA